MTGYLLAAIALFAGASVVLFNLWIKAMKDADAYKEECGNLRRELADTRLKLTEVQGIYAKADERKANMASGDIGERVDASIGILSNISASRSGGRR